MTVVSTILNINNILNNIFDDEDFDINKNIESIANHFKYNPIYVRKIIHKYYSEKKIPIIHNNTKYNYVVYIIKSYALLQKRNAGCCVERFCQVAQRIFLLFIHYIHRYLKAKAHFCC